MIDEWRIGKDLGRSYRGIITVQYLDVVGGSEDRFLLGGLLKDVLVKKFHAIYGNQKFLLCSFKPSAESIRN
jgi:hypothetical protein